MASIIFDQNDPLSIHYLSPFTVKGKSYQNVAEFISKGGAIIQGLRHKYNHHLELREGLRESEGYALIGDYGQELMLVRDEIIQHDRIIEEPLSQRELFVYCVLGNYRIKLPSLRHVYRVQREVYTLQPLEEDDIVLCRQGERTFVSKLYYYFIANGIPIYVSENEIFAIVETKDDNVKNLLSSFLLPPS